MCTLNTAMPLSRTLLVLWLTLLAGCSVWPTTRPTPTYPGGGTSGNSGGPGEGPAGGGGQSGGGSGGGNGSPAPQPGTGLPPVTSASLTFTPTILRGQVDRPLARSADAMSIGFVFEGRIDAPPGVQPYAVDPDLKITEARDDAGVNLAVGRSIGTFAVATDPAIIETWPRWVAASAPTAPSASAQASWKCMGLDRLPQRIARLRGFAVAYVPSETAERDIGISSARAPVELLPGLRLGVRNITSANQSTAIEMTLERTGQIPEFTGLSTDVPRILAATVLDQRGGVITTIPVATLPLRRPEAGTRTWNFTLSFFQDSPSQRATTLRLLLASRLERVQIPFDYQNLPLASP